MQLVILGLCIALSVTAVVGAAGDGLVVRTQQGNVVGTLVSSTVRQFLGIPYTVASRWEAPRPPPVRNTPFKAVGFGDSCVQNLSPLNMEVLKLVGLGDDNIIVPEADNCLSTNIWTPGLNRKQKTAVMIWIYGGGFQFGTSNLVFYDGQNMIQENEDILFVSFNYRTNIFGQPNAPQLSKPNQSQNFGLLDVEAAVKWVHENIAEFGGDPAALSYVDRVQEEWQPTLTLMHILMIPLSKELSLSREPFPTTMVMVPLILQAGIALRTLLGVTRLRQIPSYLV